MTELVRPYLYYDVAVSICATCYRKVEAKIVFDERGVVMMKRCPEHGPQEVLIADDVDYWRRAREVFLKPSEMPRRWNTPIRHGCPYDCGLCPDHEQHSCLSLIEITDHCNLECPTCYAESGPSRQESRSLAEVEAMLDAVVKNEGEPDVVQISGGEPTLHPQFFEILDAARARPIKHLMVNTNGLRIAKDQAFAERLAGYLPGFELYLQFDSFEPEAHRVLRGADLRAVREQALDRLDALGISTTLVVTLQRGLNDHEMGRIVDFALERPSVRGVTFQPVQDAGRVEGIDPVTDRLTLTEVRRRLAEQTEVFTPEDLVPVPCHPDCIAMGYALKEKGKVRPLTRYLDPKLLLEGGRNTIAYERDQEFQDRLFQTFSTANSPQGAAAKLKDLLCCLPRLALPKEIGYENLFRVVIMRFLDAHDFDVRSVKKSCVHIVHPEDHRLIPFDTYNLFYRGDLERTRLAPLTHGVSV